MPEFGSFCLLLALVLAVYTLVAGTISLWWSGRLAAAGPSPQLAISNKLQETARRTMSERTMTAAARSVMPP